MDPKDAKSLNPRAIFSKTGKGVQEASGKTSQLSRADRAVLAAIDGKTPLSDISVKFDKLSADKFDALIQLLDKDGFIREVSSGQSVAPTTRPAAPAPKAPSKAPPPADDGDDMDFTQAIKIPKGPAPAAPKGPAMDLAAAARAEAERKLKDQENDYKARQEADQKARAAAEAKAKSEAEARARAAAEAKAKAEADAKAHAESEARTRAEADAKVKAAREAAVRMATEAKARAEAEAKAKSEAAEREKARVEAELNAKLEAERKAREDAERRAAEAAAQARKELEEKAKRDAEEMRQRLEAEMKSKLEAERKAREEEDRKRRAEEDRKRKEEDERRAKEDAERRAKEDAERKKREDEERKRKEEDERRRKAEDERRAKEDAERKARDESDRKKRDEEDRRRKEEDDRRAKDDAERKARSDAERKAKEEAERKEKDQAAASLPSIEPVAPPPPTAAAPAAGLGDLLGDLDNFGKREEEELKAKEEAERQAKETAARKAKEAAERKAREEAEAKRREDEERRRKEEEAKRAQEEAERKEREEEERRKQEEEERKRKAKEALTAKQSAEKAAKSARSGDDVDVKDDDLDLDEIKRDQKVLAKRAEVEPPLSSVVAATGGRPKRWGKPVAIAVFVLLLGGIGILHVMPVSTADYEKGASEALGVPVKIGSARLSAITGLQLKFENVAVGDAKIRLVRGSPEIGSLFGERKSFSRMELEGVSMAQSQVADALLGKAAGTNFRVARVVINQLSLEGPLKLPPLDVEATVSADGAVQSVRASGPEKLLVQLSPKGSDLAFEISAGSLALPFVPALNLADFGMKGTANRGGVTSAEFDGRAYDGVISGTARMQWGTNWSVEGEVKARAVKVAVFAPALVSEGKLEGRANYTMTGSAPGQLYESARMKGEFKIDKGVLGSFDLTRALQTGGAQSTGRTVFNEMNGQGVYDKGVIQLRDISMTAGAMNAGASVDIDAGGGISGRIAADVKTPNQTLRAVLNISGKVRDPVIRK